MEIFTCSNVRPSKDFRVDICYSMSIFACCSRISFSVIWSLPSSPSLTLAGFFLFGFACLVSGGFVCLFVSGWLFLFSLTPHFHLWHFILLKIHFHIDVTSLCHVAGGPSCFHFRASWNQLGWPVSSLRQPLDFSHRGTPAIHHCQHLDTDNQLSLTDLISVVSCVFSLLVEDIIAVSGFERMWIHASRWLYF